MTTLQPGAHAPYADPEEYILAWTDRIWSGHGMGLIREMYAPDLVVHGAYGDIVGVEAVIRGSVSKHSAFPRRVGTPEDVVWEARGESGFISYHRALHVGPDEGPWHYGDGPTHRTSVSRGIAICLVQDGTVTEEWVVRDEAAIVEQLGMDPQQVATGLVDAGNTGVLGGSDGALLGPAPADPLIRGDSGPRPDTGKREAQLALQLFHQVWNERMFQQVRDLVHGDVIVNSAGRRTAVRHDGYVHDLLRLLGAFPDATIEVRDIAVNNSDFHGTRVGVLWRLVGTYGGAPIYGPVTHSPVDVLGSSMFLLRDGRVYREWRVYDEVAIRLQLARARVATQDQP